jgi:eukaryotic-like serine/threonine-protein kinase
MDESPIGPGPIEELAEEFVLRYRRDERPTIAEYEERYPHLAEEIRGFFRAIMLVEDLKPHADALSSLDLGATGGCAPPIKQLGDYRILREVGRGGMGVVYEAEQESLGRRVALKVLAGSARLDPRQLARFHREARAAARLHHTNIVPVFGVGEDDGLHYYVMQFIPGLGLDQVLKDLKQIRDHKSPTAAPVPQNTKGCSSSAGDISDAILSDTWRSDGSAHGRETFERFPRKTSSSEAAASTSSSSAALPSGSDGTGSSSSGKRYARSVASIGVQVAEALAHAHQNGTLHRDIKPSNLLIDPRGGVWVTDFGLAKAADHDDLTLSGDIVGTVRYMAPERFDGRCDARSDVYSLGLTLYEMLALRAAFEASDRQQLIRQVVQLQPKRLHGLDPSIPRDLETVVHKAIEKEPARRYASAAEMAGDLRRFLEDRPVEARRVSALGRLTRWAWRNPLPASLGSAVISLLAAIAVLSSTLALQIERRSGEVRREADRAKQERGAAILSAAKEAHARRDAQDAEKRTAQAHQKLRKSAYVMGLNFVQMAAEAQNFGRARQLLEQQRPAPGETDLRGWEWHYWNRLCYADTLTFSGHAAPVWDVAFRPRSDTVASVGNDFKARIWSARDGLEIRALEAGSRVLGSVAFSADGSLLAAGDWGGTIHVWNADTYQKTLTIPAHAGSALGVAFSPDGAQIASASMDGTTKTWNKHDGRLIKAYERGPGPMHQVAFSPDGTRLLAVAMPRRSGESKSVTRVWDTASGERVLELEDDRLAAFSLDGKLLATYSGRENVIRLRNAVDGLEVRRFKVEARQVAALAFSADASLIASSEDEVLRVRGVADDRRFVHIGHVAALNRIAFSPDGSQIASTSRDGTVKIRPAIEREQRQLLRAHDGLVGALAYHPDGRSLASAGHDGFINIWDPATGRAALILKGHAGPILALSFHPEGHRLASAGADQTVRVWDSASGELLRTLKGHTATVRDVAYSPDGRRIASVGDDRTLRMWNAEDGSEAFAPIHTEGSLSALAFRPNSRTIAVAGFQRIELLDGETGRRLQMLRGNERPISPACLAYSHHGRYLVTGGLDRRLALWDVDQAKLLGALEGHSGPIRGVRFSRDDRRIISSSADGTVRVWDVDSHAELLSLKIHPDGSRIRLGPGTTTNYPPTDVALHPNGTMIAASGNDGVIAIWDGTPLSTHTSRKAAQKTAGSPAE